MTSVQAAQRRTWNANWKWGAFLALLVVIAYSQVAWAGFIWDDDAYVTHNVPLRSTGGLWQIWFVPGATEQYYPLSNTSFWLEYRLWGAAPLGYHVDNVLLQIANALVLWLILRKLEIPGAWFAAALFSLHPVTVESVAWITERKNTLSGLFFFSSILASMEFWKIGADTPYLFAKRDARNRQWFFFWIALSFYLLALLAKTATSPLPIVVLLLLWWKRPKLELRDLAPLGPFFVVGLAMGLLTLWIEKNYVGTTGSEWEFSAPDRCIIIGKALWFYLGKLAWPHPLIFVYPRWKLSPAEPLMYAPLVAAIAGMIFLWWKRNTSWRPVFLAMAYFAIMLLPACGTFNQYFFRYSFVADHLQYLASIGPLTLAAVGITTALEFFVGASPFLRPVVIGIVLTTLSVLTWRQSSMYRNEETLWQTTLAQNPACWMAEVNLGSYYLVNNRLDESVRELEKGLAIDPHAAEAESHYSLALQQDGKAADAITHAQKAVQLNPGSAEAETNLAVVCLRQGKLDEAIEHSQKAIAISPNYYQAENNLAVALLQKKDLPGAVAHAHRALAISPNYGEAHYNLANVLLISGHAEDAITEYKKALDCKPDLTQAETNLGIALGGTGDLADAVRYLRDSVQKNPADPVAHNALGLALARSGDITSAAACFQEAVRLKPDFAEAQRNLKKAQSMTH